MVCLSVFSGRQARRDGWMDDNMHWEGEKGFTRKSLRVECEAFLFLSLLLAYFCLLLLPSVCLSELGSSGVESAVERVDLDLRY